MTWEYVPTNGSIAVRIGVDASDGRIGPLETPVDRSPLV